MGKWFSWTTHLSHWWKNYVRNVQQRYWYGIPFLFLFLFSFFRIYIYLFAANLRKWKECPIKNLMGNRGSKRIIPLCIICLPSLFIPFFIQPLFHFNGTENKNEFMDAIECCTLWDLIRQQPTASIPHTIEATNWNTYKNRMRSQWTEPLPFNIVESN